MGLRGGFGLKRKYILRYLIVFVLVCLLAGAVLVVKPSLKKIAKAKPPSEACLKISASADEAMQNGDQSKAYSELLKTINECAKSSDKKFNMLYIAKLAISSYETNHKESGTKYAKDALAIGRQMNGAQQSHIANYPNLVITLNQISNGRYNGLGFVE